MNKVRIHFQDAIACYELACFLKEYMNDNCVIICIGTDRCIGDCLGPLTGSFLKEKASKLPVYGTISNPIHALNLEKEIHRIKLLHPHSKFIGIDACLGDLESIGEIQGRNYPIQPGKGVGKSLPSVGDISIIGIVDSADNNELFTNRTIRLNLVMKMSKVIANGILHAERSNSVHRLKSL